MVVVDTRLDAKAAADAGVKTVELRRVRQLSRRPVDRRVPGQGLAGGKAKVAILEGIAGHETGDSRVEGLPRGGEGQRRASQIVASQTANWERDQGFNVFQNILQAHPEIDTVFACNDMMALGAIEAINAGGKAGKIRVLGFDAVKDARAALESGHDGRHGRAVSG